LFAVCAFILAVGTFELDLPALQDNKLLCLIFTYYNADARLTETRRVDVYTYSLLSARNRAVGGNWSETVDNASGNDTCTVRYEKKPLELQIGGGSLPAVLRMRDKTISLEFEGLHAIFLNTFILKAPYLNQNRQSFTVKAVVPSAKLLQVRPMLVPEAAFRGQLPDGGNSANGRTDVHFNGSVVCFPTCATMALGCLGALDVPDKGQTEHIQEVAQGIYDYVATDVQPPPWTFPFPADAAAKIAEDEKKIQAAEAAAKGLVQLVQAIADLKSVQDDEAAQMVPFRTYWPFVAATKDDENKQWLVTLNGSRPWQYHAYVANGINKSYAGTVHADFRDGYNVFEHTIDAQIRNVLARGCPATVSIEHKDSNGKKGGHLILLVGAVIRDSGSVARLIFHDPYGDQTQYPHDEGYYDPAMYSGGANTRTDVDRAPHTQAPWALGAYAPYSNPDINSFGGSIRGKNWTIYSRVGDKPTPNSMRDRLLPSQPPP